MTGGLRLRARRGRSPPLCGELTFRTPARHRAPQSGTWQGPDPGRRSSRGSGAQTRPVCPAMAATRTPAASPVSTTSWRYGLRRTCRLVTGRSHRPRSTWPDQARLAFLAVAHRYKRTYCLWLEPFQIADYGRVLIVHGSCRFVHRTTNSASRILCNLGVVSWLENLISPENTENLPV